MIVKRERKLQRLKNYDYSHSNPYFVTICCHNKEHFLGEIKNGEIILNQSGNIVYKQWLWLEEQYSFVALDEFVIMPNHFHGILIIDRDNWSWNGQAHSVQKIEEGTDNVPHCSIDSIKSLSQLIGAFKTLSSHNIHKLELTKDNHISPNLPTFKWHKSFYDRIIRNEKELNNIRNYIKNNPIKWDLDIENSKEKINNIGVQSYYEKMLTNLTLSS